MFKADNVNRRNGKMTMLKERKEVRLQGKETARENAMFPQDEDGRRQRFTLTRMFAREEGALWKLCLARSGKDVLVSWCFLKMNGTLGSVFMQVRVKLPELVVVVRNFSFRDGRFWKKGTSESQWAFRRNFTFFCRPLDTHEVYMSLRVRSGNVYCWISSVEIVDKLRQVRDSMVRIHAKYRLHIRNKIGLFCLLHKYPVAPVAIFIS